MYVLHNLLFRPEPYRLALDSLSVIHITSSMVILVLSPETLVLSNSDERISSCLLHIPFERFLFQNLTAFVRNILADMCLICQILPLLREHPELTSLVSIEQIISVSLAEPSFSQLPYLRGCIFADDWESFVLAYPLKTFLRSYDFQFYIQIRKFLFQPFGILFCKHTHFRKFCSRIGENERYLSL